MRDKILLIAAALLAFGLSAAGVFHFDDYSLFEDARLTSLTAIRPLTNLTFQLNMAAGGRDPLTYHLVNLLLHIGAVLLLHRALARVLPAPAALLAGLIFAVHPIQTEPVNYIFARGTLLATLLCLASLDAWLSDRLWVAVAFFGAALLAKEECVAFPIFLLLLDLSREGRLRWRRYAPIGAMVALTLAVGLRVVIATSAIQGTATGFGARTSPLEYLSIQGPVILHYGRLIAIPWGLTIDADGNVPALAWRLGAWALIVAAAVIAVRWFPKLGPGFWFLGALLLLAPSSSIFPVDDYVAERRLYLPMVALAPALALAAGRVDRRILALVLILWSAISIHYCWIWQSEQRLWTEAVRLAPAKVRPRIQLARAAGSPDQALAVLADAQNLAPGDASVASEQGRVLLAAGHPAEALAAFGRALARSPRDAMNISNRGAALMVLGQADAARQDFERALQLDPCQFNARVNLHALKVMVASPPAQCRYTADQLAQLNP